jgi:hypothetical protein
MNNLAPLHAVPRRCTFSRVLNAALYARPYDVTETPECGGDGPSQFERRDQG